VELYVTRCALYPDAEEVDIRGWIIDDNVGSFNTSGCTTGVGITTGHLRFADVAAWANVPVGTVIVLFNGADNCYDFTVNESGTGPYFINANSTSLLQRTGSGATPNSGGDCDYCGNSYTATGASAWTSVMGLGNTADAIQVRCPDCPESEAGFFHGVGYGSSFGAVNAGTNDLGGAYFSGNGTERSYELTGTGCGTLGDAGGWTRYSVPAAGTPPATAGVVDAGVLAWLEECQVPCCGNFEPPAVVQKHGYRFGFNGQEKDDEVHGATGTSYDFGARMQDPRTGRFLSIDPAASKLPGVSVYAYGANNPIAFVDYNGEFPISIHVRSFAPFDWFGARGWKGDNRGFSTSPSATSRIRQITAYETETRASSTRAIGGWSHSQYGATAFSDAFVDDQSFGNRVYTHLYGDNDAFIPGLDWGGPTSDIDLWTDVFINTTTRDDGSALLTIQGDGSRRPVPDSRSLRQ
jgi:RHS repeat-associated protein